MQATSSPSHHWMTRFCSVRQRLKFDGVPSGMTPDPKRSKETVRHGEIREPNPLPGESPDKKKVRFSLEPGDGGACAITVEELVEDSLV